MRIGSQTGRRTLPHGHFCDGNHTPRQRCNIARAPAAPKELPQESPSSAGARVHHAQRGNSLRTALLTAVGLLALDFASFILVVGVIGSCWDAEPACGKGSEILIYLGAVGVVISTVLLAIDVLVLVFLLLARLAPGNARRP